MDRQAYLDKRVQGQVRCSETANDRGQIIISLRVERSAADVGDGSHGGRQAQTRRNEERWSELRRSSLAPTTAPGLESREAGAATLEC